MCILCQNIQSGLISIERYDKDKEDLRHQLYLKFDLNHYVLEKEDLTSIIDIFSYRRIGWHKLVMLDAVELFSEGCRNMKGK